MKRALALALSGLVLAGACSEDDAETPPPTVPVDDGGQGGTATGATPQGGEGGALGGAGGEGAGVPVHINDGWIGGPCASDADCDYEGGRCLTELPDGMCTLDCAQFCPDQDDAVQTFCTTSERLEAPANFAEEGLCTMRCDYGVSPTGCRDGYQCQVVARYMEPEVEVYGCVPGTDAPFELSECHQELLDRGIAFTPAVDPLDSPDGMPEVICDIDRPVWVTPYLSNVAFHPASLANDPASIFTACEHALAMANTAEVLEGDGVDGLVHLGVYNCRVIAGTSTVSQHGYANAIDIAGLHFATGEYYTIEGDWEIDDPTPMTSGGQFLYDFAHTLYDEVIYNIILTPDYNEAHYNHFHCDLTEGSHFLQ
jgi:hypothetical protein